MVKDYDYDEEIRHLGYTASLIGSSAAAETKLAAKAKKATMVFRRMPRLRGVVVRRSIMACWSTSNDGWIHAVIDDEDNGWQVPTMLSL